MVRQQTFAAFARSYFAGGGHDWGFTRERRQRLEAELIAYFQGRSSWKKEMLDNVHQRVCKRRRVRDHDLWMRDVLADVNQPLRLVQLVLAMGATKDIGYRALKTYWAEAQRELRKAGVHCTFSVPSRNTFNVHWKLALRPLRLVETTVDNIHGLYWPFEQWAAYVAKRAPLCNFDLDDWGIFWQEILADDSLQPTTGFSCWCVATHFLHRDSIIGLRKCILKRNSVYVAGGSWTQMSVTILNHGSNARRMPFTHIIAVAWAKDSDFDLLYELWKPNFMVCTVGGSLSRFSGKAARFSHLC